MVGVPSSKGCQTCKRRKIKCDESWPTCKQCRIGKRQCPGPSSTTKFVHNNRHTRGATDDAAQSQWVNFSSTQVVPVENRTLLKSVTTDGGPYIKFRLVNSTPRAHPTTIADRVSARLVSSLERGSDGDVTMCYGYLHFLPQRVSESVCLRDMVTLFCAAWKHYRVNNRRPEFVKMKEYGKALRSLYAALNTKGPPSVETLTAMLILERSHKIFDLGKLNLSHVEAIRNAVQIKGPPSMNDDLDLAIAVEYHAILSTQGALQNKDYFLNSPEWKKVMDECLEQHHSVNPGQEPFVGPAQGFFTSKYEEWPSWLERARAIFADPYGGDNPERAANFILELRPINREVSQQHNELEQIAVNAGKISLVPDPDSVIGEKYKFQNKILGLAFNSPTLLRLIILNLIYYIGQLYGPPDEATYAEYRDVAIKAWKCLPFFRSLDMCVAREASLCFYLAYEVAVSDAERNLLWEHLREGDKLDQKEPKTEKRMHNEILFLTAVVTGRKPPGTKFDPDQDYGHFSSRESC